MTLGLVVGSVVIFGAQELPDGFEDDLRISEMVDVPNFLVTAFLPLDIFSDA